MEPPAGGSPAQPSGRPPALDVFTPASTGSKPSWEAGSHNGAEHPPGALRHPPPLSSPPKRVGAEGAWRVDYLTKLRSSPHETADWADWADAADGAAVARPAEPLERLRERDEFTEVRTRAGAMGWIRTSYLSRFTLGDRVSRGVTFPEPNVARHTSGHRGGARQRHMMPSPVGSAASWPSTAHSAGSTVRLALGGVSARHSELDIPIPHACWHVLGPGLVVMLADSDAGSLIVSAQTGKAWGYSFVLLQALLCVPLYMAQELCVRVAVTLRMGYAEAVAHLYGRVWSAAVVLMLVVICTGALCTEMSAIAGVGQVVGIPPEVACGFLVIFLFAVVATGSYRQVEAVSLLFGFFEFAFFITAALARPSWKTVAEGLVQMPIDLPGYRVLLAANIGAVMQPWMIIYQQSAVVDKELTEADLPAARWDTRLGAVITQAVATSVMLTAAGTAWSGSYDGSSSGFGSVAQISNTLTPHLGVVGGRLLFCVGFIGSAAVGAIVVSLTAAWGLGEAFGFERSLESDPQEAPWFYVSFAAILFAAYAIAMTAPDLIVINVLVQVVNAALLPVMLALLFAMGRVLPQEHRLQGWTAVAYAAVFALCSGVGVICTLPVFV